MSTPVAPAPRLLRAGLVTLWGMLLAVGAHVAGSGEAPPAVALVPVAAGVAALTWWATAHRIRFAGALVLLALPQLAVHALSGYVHGHQVLPTSAAMVAAHLAGVALMAAGVAGAERLWWAAWRRVAVVVGPVRSRPRPVTRPVVPSPAPPLVTSLLDHVVVRRGPPFSRVVSVPVTRACG